MFLLTLGNRKWILLYIILRDLVIILVDQMAELPLYVEQIVQGEMVFNHIVLPFLSFFKLGDIELTQFEERNGNMIWLGDMEMFRDEEIVTPSHTKKPIDRSIVSSNSI